MLLTDLLKEYIQAQLGYESEANQLKTAKKDWRAAFMERTGATKSELRMIDSAIKVNMKLDTEFEINEFVENVQKVSDFFNKLAPGNENVTDTENPMLTDPVVIERNVKVDIDGREIGSAVVTTKSLNENWNPPPGPKVPAEKSKRTVN
jgi:hypothetical protein